MRFYLIFFYQIDECISAMSALLDGSYAHTTPDAAGIDDCSQHEEYIEFIDTSYKETELCSKCAERYIRQNNEPHVCKPDFTIREQKGILKYKNVTNFENCISEQVTLPNNSAKFHKSLDKKKICKITHTRHKSKKFVRMPIIIFNNDSVKQRADSTKYVYIPDVNVTPIRYLLMNVLGTVTYEKATTYRSSEGTEDEFERLNDSYFNLAHSSYADKWKIYCNTRMHKHCLKTVNHNSDMHTYILYYGTVPMPYNHTAIHFMTLILQMNSNKCKSSAPSSSLFEFSDCEIEVLVYRYWYISTTDLLNYDEKIERTHLKQCLNYLVNNLIHLNKPFFYELSQVCDFADEHHVPLSALVYIKQNFHILIKVAPKEDQPRWHKFMHHLNIHHYLCNHTLKYVLVDMHIFLNGLNTEISNYQMLKDIQTINDESKASIGLDLIKKNTLNQCFSYMSKMQKMYQNL